VAGGLEMANEYMQEAAERVAGTWEPPVVEPKRSPLKVREALRERKRT
jgi:hypothetical protein